MDMRSEEAEPVTRSLEEAVTLFSAQGHSTRLAQRLMRAGEWGLAFQELYFMNREDPSVLDPRRYREIEGAFAPIIDVNELDRQWRNQAGGGKVSA